MRIAPLSRIQEHHQSLTTPLPPYYALCPTEKKIQKSIKNTFHVISFESFTACKHKNYRHSMGETAAVITNGATNTSNAASDSSPPPSQDDQPPIPGPPDIVVIEKPTCPHTLSAQQVADKLETDLYDGLTAQDAAARLARDGPNAIKGAKGVSLWEIFMQQVANALTAVLIAVAALSFAIQDYIEAGVVVAVILLNIIVG